MARFKGIIQGQAGETSRLGSVESGFQAEVSGQDVGVEIDANPLNSSEDTITIKATSGASGGKAKTVAVIWGNPPTIDLYKDESIIASFPLEGER